MSDTTNTPLNDVELLTVNMIDSLIARAESILARDISLTAHPAIQAALVRLAHDKTIELLLDKAATVATVHQFDIDIKEA